CQKYSSVPLTF
nr:immunoglobulin light chain junction region [Macaca mulatta]